MLSEAFQLEDDEKRRVNKGQSLDEVENETCEAVVPLAPRTSDGGAGCDIEVADWRFSLDGR